MFSLIIVFMELLSATGQGGQYFFVMRTGPCLPARDRSGHAITYSIGIHIIGQLAILQNWPSGIQEWPAILIQNWRFFARNRYLADDYWFTVFMAQLV